MRKLNSIMSELNKLKTEYKQTAIKELCNNIRLEQNRDLKFCRIELNVCLKLFFKEYHITANRDKILIFCLYHYRAFKSSYRSSFIDELKSFAYNNDVDMRYFNFLCDEKRIFTDNTRKATLSHRNMKESDILIKTKKHYYNVKCYTEYLFNMKNIEKFLTYKIK